jgi:O-antigen/teichoic acid export membrane protein
MLPMAADWLHRRGAIVLLRRLYLLAAGLVVVALCYFVVLWLLRDWIFAVLHQDFQQRDELLLLWGATFLLIVIRDQLIYLPAAQGRFHALTMLSLLGAVVALAIGYWGIVRFGLRGALLGALCGELVNVTGIALLSAGAAIRQSKGIAAASALPERNSP